MKARRALAALALVVAAGCTLSPDEGGRSFVQVDGVRIHYIQAGRGERTVLLLHGYGSGAHTWDGIQARVPPGFASYAIDLPGFGYSDKPESYDYGIEAFASTAVGFLKLMKRPPAVVAGNSMGGIVSLWAAAHHPEWVAGVVPIDSAGAPISDKAPPFYVQMVRWPGIGPLLLRFPSKTILSMTLRQVYHDKTRLSPERIEQYYRPSRFPGAPWAWHRAMVDLMAKTESGAALEIMKNVRQEVLLLWGAQDPWVSPAGAVAFRERMPQARLKVYESLGHVPQEEAPEQVAPDLYGFASEVFEKAEALGEGPP